MGRIRTIKPEFPQSESMGRVSRDARLLFLMLFTIADDEGRGRAASRMLASLLFPYDDDAPMKIPEWLMELERQKSIIVYAIDGNSYFQILNWLDHQKIDRPSASKIPPAPSRTKPRAKSASARDVSTNAREYSSLDQGREGIKEGIKDQGLEDRASQKTKRASPRTQVPETLFPNLDLEADARQFWATHSRIDLTTPEAMADQIAQFVDHHRATGKTMADWNAAWRTWYRNALKFNRKSNGHDGQDRSYTAFRRGALLAVQELDAVRNAESDD